jgi:hypothetical protein
LIVKLTPTRGEAPWLWTVRARRNGTWASEVLPGWLRSHQLLGDSVDSVYVTAVSRTGIESPLVGAATKRK